MYSQEDDVTRWKGQALILKDLLMNVYREEGDHRCYILVWGQQGTLDMYNFVGITAGEIVFSFVIKVRDAF